MDAKLYEFIPLNRTFHELAFDEDAGDDSELRRLFGQVKPIHWSDLLAEHRVILLSEAGSGSSEYASLRSIAAFGYWRHIG